MNAGVAHRDIKPQDLLLDSLVLIMVVILLFILLSIVTIKMLTMTCKTGSTAADRTSQTGTVQPEAPDPPSPPQSAYCIIKDWTRGELIGKGGFGEVFLALDRKSGALFATKKVPLIRDIHGRRAFKGKVDSLRKEIQTLSHLSHPNIVQYLGTSKSSRNLYVHLEYVEGGSLEMLIKEFGTLSLQLIQHYTEQVLTGLAFLHSKGLVHRDIKPSNILVSKDGRCKLADFGCVKHFEELRKNTSFTGTAIYMSPESHQQRNVCPKADIWSMGCTVIEMVNGDGPIWFNMNHYQLFVYVSGNKFDPKIPASLGEDGMDFVSLCLTQRPENRADATTLLKHPFIIDKQLEMKKVHSFKRITSDSSFAGFPNMTRHSSVESQEFAYKEENKQESINRENLYKAYSQSMKNAMGCSEAEKTMNSTSMYNSLSRKSSAGSLYDHHPAPHPQQAPAKLQDVELVVQMKSQAVKQKHLKWLAMHRAVNTVENSGARRNSAPNSNSDCSTQSLRKGSVQSRDQTAPKGNDCDFDTL